MRIFVAGATGVIGRGLVALLIEAGHEVTGMTRSPARADRLLELGCEAAVCDALDGSAVREAVSSARPDAVIHVLTAIPPDMQPRDYKTALVPTNRLRHEGTRNLIAAAQAAGATRFVAESVAFAYEPSGPWVKDEQEPLAVDSPPPMDRVIGALASLERQVGDAGGIVLRYGFLYGPGTWFASDGLFARMARRRMFPVLGSGEGRWSFIHADDAATATVAALERGAAGVYNIVDDEPARAADWIPAYASAMGARRPLHLPAWIGRLAAGGTAVRGMTEQRGASNVKAKSELGWEPRYASWRDGFRTAGG
ncbi:MAG TPA: NAD(P)-dependent oxidoreductase [Solirubrobacteraceae bacterium]|jgi:nucleoside-diphosphate-sugar epimerase